MDSEARYIGIDWSGAKSSSDPKIYVAEVVAGEQLSVRSVVRAADREAIRLFLLGKELEVASTSSGLPKPAPPVSGEPFLVGLDFAFGFPVSFEVPGKGLEWEWEDLADWCSTLDVADMDARIAGDPIVNQQFRRTGGPPVPDLALRTTESLSGGNPSSVLNLVGSRQVGKGSIRGIAMLKDLRSKGLTVWPFDGLSDSKATVVEVYPAEWLAIGISKSKLEDREKQVEIWRKSVLIPDGIAEAIIASPDALDATAAAIGLAGTILPDRGELAAAHPEVIREGWILGPDSAP